MSSPHRDALIIAGPNGAGKSTIFPAIRSISQDASPYVPGEIPAENFVNADTIASQHGVSTLAAGRLALRSIDEHISRRNNFALETTLSGLAYQQTFKKLKANGYRIYISFIWLRSHELSVIRVVQRALVGKHYIPLDSLISRFSKSLLNFTYLYRKYADFWVLADNSGISPEITAWGGSIFSSNKAVYCEDKQSLLRFADLLTRLGCEEFNGKFPEFRIDGERVNPHETDRLTPMILETINSAVREEIAKRPAGTTISIWGETDEPQFLFA
ncbi:MAG: zeta toxin family protein [Synechococcaceae cyanobacterium]|nr:zeta toxin family protein [Synechococcaceae cyanobacterium]